MAIDIGRRWNALILSSAAAMPAPTITANQLRALAERADSRRGRQVLLVETPAGSQEPYDIVDVLGPGQREVLPLLTNNDLLFAPRAPLTLSSAPAVTITGRPGLGINGCDAVFTSITSFEKFVVPYYTRFKTPAEIDTMRAAYYTDSAALAVVHLPDSIEDTVRALGTMSSLFVLRQSDAGPDLHVQSIESLIAPRAI